MKMLDLENLGLTPLSETESINIDGGETNPLMHGGPDLPNFDTVVGFIAGFFGL